MSEDVSLGIGFKEPRLTNETFEKRIRSLIEAKYLTDLELKKLLLDPEVKFVPLNRNNNVSLPSVSIVLPVYNDQEVVINCLKTLVRQTYRNIQEIVVVDDGSTDESIKVLKEFEKTHPLVRVIESKHIGRSATRNIGLKNVRGQIVLFTESDAMYAPWYLEKAVDLLMTKNADAAMLQGSWILNSSIISKCILVLDQIKWRQISAGKKKIESAWIFKTPIVRKVGGFDEKIESGEDKDLLRRIRSADVRIEYAIGYNWFHPTPNSLKKYLQRRLDEQRKKSAQHRKRKEYCRLLSIMILLMVTFLFVTYLIHAIGLLLYLLPFTLFTLCVLFYFYRLTYLLREHKNVSYRMYLFILPIISLLSIFPKIIGTILGKWKHRMLID
ncbi:MAG: glycosyltransferase [Candidatus Hodarchaeota archaeon]